MKTLRKKLIAITLTLSLLAGLTPAVSFAAVADDSGSGWTFTAETKMLTVTSNDGTTAWRTEKANFEFSDVETVIIESGVTSIGEEAFRYTALTSIVIPNNVLLIATRAFQDCESLTSVTLPVHQNFNTIAPYTFENTGLTEITIPNSVTTINVNAFQITNLNTVTIPNSVTTIGINAFRSCTDLTSVTFMGETPPSFGNSVFDNTPKLHTIYLQFGPKAAYVTALGANLRDDIEVVVNFYAGDGWSFNTATKTLTVSTNNATADWRNGRGPDTFSISDVENIVFEGNITQIQENAFYQTRITSVTIPNSVTTIRQSAFQDTRLTEVVIPNSVTSIGTLAFGNCTSLRSVVLPTNPGFTSIGNNAFQNTGLTSIEIPANVTAIGQSVFDLCKKLETMSFYGETPPTFSPNVIRGTDELHTIYVPFGTKAAYENALDVNDNLRDDFNVMDVIYTDSGWSFNSATKTLTVTSNDGTIGWRTGREPVSNPADFSFNDVETVIIGDNVTSISSTAFQNCTGLKFVTFPNNPNFTTIGSLAFRRTGLESIIIPDSVTSIGSAAFRDCANLKSIILPNNSAFTTLSDNMFHDSGLESIIIPDSVTEINAYAFNNCASLKSVTLPNNPGFTTIRGRVFEKTGLESIIIPSSVTTIESRAFEDCVELESVSFLGATPPAEFGSPGGWPPVFPELPKLTTIFVPCGAKSAYMAVAELSKFDMATFGCTLPPDWTNGTAATCDTASTRVKNCTECDEVIENEDQAALGHIYISNSDNTHDCTRETTAGGCGTVNEHCLSGQVAGICGKCGAEFVFSGNGWEFDPATSILTITTDGGTTAWRTGRSPTQNPVDFSWRDVQTVVIRDTVTSIGDSAFMNCTYLTSVTIQDGVTSIGGGAFRLCERLTSIIIPDSVTRIGISAFAGCTNLTDVTLPNNPNFTEIEDSTFLATALTSITIPDSVTDIGSNAFMSCKSLTSIVIPDGVTTIRSEAFNNCTKLTSIVFPDSVTEIGRSAFRDCSDLTDVTFHGMTPPVFGTGVFLNTSKLHTIYVPFGAGELYKAQTALNGIEIVEYGWFYVNFSAVDELNGSITATSSTGTFSSGDKVAENETVTFTATPDDGYAIKEWRHNGEIVNGVEFTYSTQITEETTITVEFYELPIPEHIVNFSVINGLNGTLTATSSAGAFSSGDMIAQGETVTFTATPDDGYGIKEWRHNGEIVNGIELDYSTQITKASTVTVEFKDVSAPVYEMGDCNNDGKINIADLTYLKRVAVGYMPEIFINNPECWLTDESKRTQKPEAADITRLKDFLTGKISSL